MTVRALGRTTLLVLDYDKAIAFYRDRLGFHVVRDEKQPDGARVLHMAMTSQQGEPVAGLWLVEAKDADETLVGRQAGTHPFLVLHTDNCNATVRELEHANVEIRQRPEASDGVTSARVADLYGNELLIVELKRATPFVTQAIPARSTR